MTEAPGRQTDGVVDRCKMMLYHTWKSFSYDHHITLRRLHHEATSCASSLLLWCLLCLLAGLTISYVETVHPEAKETRDTEGEIVKQERETVEELWRAFTVVQQQEEEWKVLAQLTLRKLREEAEVLRGCDWMREEGEHFHWGVLESFVYMLTVTTSIGYGHIYPKTNAGRALTIVYAILGIPIFLILMADFGKLFTRLLKSLFVFARRMYRSPGCRRVRKSRQAKSVKSSPPCKSSSKALSPPLAVPETSMTDIDKMVEVEEVEEKESQVREREPFLSEAQKAEVQEQRKKEEHDEQEAVLGEDDDCCCSLWWKSTKARCWQLCGRKKEVEPEPEPEPEEPEAVDDNFDLPISLALFILLLYFLLGCLIYTMWEEWSYFEAFYFIFVSMTTIGFGDYVPKHPAFMMLTTVYLVFGLALTAMCINIIQEKLTNTFRQASEKLKESLGTIMATVAQGEEGALPEGRAVEIAAVHGGGGKDTDTAPPPPDTVSLKKET